MREINPGVTYNFLGPLGGIWTIRKHWKALKNYINDSSNIDPHLFRLWVPGAGSDRRSGTVGLTYKLCGHPRVTWLRHRQQPRAQKAAEPPCAPHEPAHQPPPPHAQFVFHWNPVSTCSSDIFLSTFLPSFSCFLVLVFRHGENVFSFSACSDWNLGCWCCCSGDIHWEITLRACRLSWFFFLFPTVSLSFFSLTEAASKRIYLAYSEAFAYFLSFSHLTLACFGVILVLFPGVGGCTFPKGSEITLLIFIFENFPFPVSAKLNFTRVCFGIFIVVMYGTFFCFLTDWPWTKLDDFLFGHIQPIYGKTDFIQTTFYTLEPHSIWDSEWKDNHTQRSSES